MKIIKRVNQFRRDFNADMICEGCGAEARVNSCYDDRNFHDNVIPAMKCKQCSKSRNDLGIVGELTPTKYAEHEVV